MDKQDMIKGIISKLIDKYGIDKVHNAVYDLIEFLNEDD